MESIGALLLLGVAVTLIALLVTDILREWSEARARARQQRSHIEQARIQAEADRVGRQLAEQAFRVQRDMLRRATGQDKRDG